MKPAEIKSFDDLRRYLSTFTTWDGDQVHDFGGVFALLGTLLDNIRANVLEADLEIIGGYLNSEQKAFLKRLDGFASLPDVE